MRRRQLGKAAIAYAASLSPSERAKPWTQPTDVFAGVVGLPEIPRRELDVQRLASSILYHGGLVVRGMLSPERVASLRSHLAGGPSCAAICMTPEAVEELLAAYEDLAGVLCEYLGELPVAALQRTRLKRNVNEPGLRWHQDGPLFGGERRAVNFWTALTPVGEDRPGLSLVPCRVTEIFAPDYDLADMGDYRCDDAVQMLSERVPPVSPVLAPGDTVVFDEMTLHRTQALPWKVMSREIAVTWFFAPSRTPATIGRAKTAEFVPAMLMPQRGAPTPSRGGRVPP